MTLYKFNRSICILTFISPMKGLGQSVKAEVKYNSLECVRLGDRNFSFLNKDSFIRIKQ